MPGTFLLFILATKASGKLLSLPNNTPIFFIKLFLIYSTGFFKNIFIWAIKQIMFASYRFF
jgi:hypothetical protein